MLFRLLSQIRDFPMQSGTTLDMPLVETPGATVLMRPPDEAESPPRFRERDAVCVVTCERSASEKIRLMFETLASGRVPSGWVKAEHWENRIHADGRLKQEGVNQRYLPPARRDFLKSIQKDMRDARDRIVSVVRWRYDIRSGPLTFVAGESRWSLDGEAWHPTPAGEVTGSIGLQAFFNPSERAPGVLVGLVKQGEPVGHELFREAWHNRHSNPRSALLMGIAALEVGFKECVADLVPAAGWLVENAPSPPVTKMLTDYLPTLDARLKFNNKVLPPPESIIKELVKGVSLRNKVTHTGADAPHYESLEGILYAVRDVLWLLDYYRGHEWAIQYLRYETQQVFAPDSVEQ